MRRALPLLLLTLAATAGADDYPIDARVNVQAYRFELTLADEDDVVRGVATVRMALRETVESVGLDLIGGDGTGMTVNAVSVDGESADFAHRSDRLIIAVSADAAADGELVVVVQYAGTPADGLVIGATKHGVRAFFGDNYPDRARHWLPTVDHVSDKATVEFIVTAPERYQVIASGALREETDLGDGRRRTHWASSVPLATKVMVIGVTEFAVQRLQPVNGIPVESWVYPQDRDAGFHDFALARPILEYFDRAIGPYPYEKLANVQSKTRYGGMENAGNIFYSENAIRGDRTNEGLLAHEIAHQWFGDGVSEADWHHVWLSEGFATYFTQLYMEHAHGRERLLAGMRAARESVLRYHATGPGYAIVDERFGMRGLLSANSYQKGAWVLHMLRRQVGDAAFWRGIRTYYARFRDDNALTEDFRDVMEEAAGADLDWFFAQWVYRPGQPRLAGTWSWEGGTLAVQVLQTQPELYRAAVDVSVLDAAGARTDHTLRLEGATGTLVLELADAPTEVVLDADAWLLFEDGGFWPAPESR